MKRKFTAIVAAMLAMTTVLAACGSSSSSTASTTAAAASGETEAAAEASGDTAASGEAEYTWKMALNSAPGEGAYDTGAAFAEKIEELTEGRVHVDLYGGAALGTTSEVLEGMGLGVADCMVEGVSTIATFSPTADIDFMPYIYSSFDHWKAVWQDSDLGDQIKETVRQESGFRLLGASHRTPRIMDSTKEIHTIEDIEGLKIRVPNLKVTIATWEWLKAAPTPLATNETYTALQQKTVDASENPIADLKSFGYDEVCKYWIKTNHAYGTNVVIFSDAYFSSLPEDIQNACIEAADYASDVVTQAAVENADKIEAELTESGITFIEVDIQSFIDYFADFYETNFPDLVPLINEIKAKDPNA